MHSYHQPTLGVFTIQVVTTMINLSGALMRYMDYMGWGYENIRRGQVLFSSHTRLDVGNGSWTQLRRDLWFGARVLKESV